MTIFKLLQLKINLICITITEYAKKIMVSFTIIYSIINIVPLIAIELHYCTNDYCCSLDHFYVIYCVYQITLISLQLQHIMVIMHNIQYELNVMQLGVIFNISIIICNKCNYDRVCVIQSTVTKQILSRHYAMYLIIICLSYIHILYVIFSMYNDNF